MKIENLTHFDDNLSVRVRLLPDGALLKLLAERFPPDRLGGCNFDHWSISSEASSCPELIEALAFLGVQRRKTGPTRGSLTVASDKRIARWLRLVEGREIAGLWLERDTLGWYRICRR